ncbi:hypothetical protein TCAL_08336 [Tigriopus californicus]|uniref:Uncharacterized protein n=1 Tax=Tigriopus californicus TaxID=6832 RepID=A0A553PN97_TIGCA|nr:uncharacterized protein LOC131882033 [Tigriopus californicus]TRY79165.1 hypothetical protein TCAL_08336 [Tigriopus californicus]|eukprot:TCALIF_08336-PA protein Name:"Protein of unknown function" AED:0.00 eAED:0.00 QI:91/1/0.66/1/1/1/3/199/204
MVGLVKTNRYHDPRCHNKQQHWIATTSSSSSTFMGFRDRERSWLRVDACCIRLDLILGTQIIAAFGFFSSIFALFLSYKSLIQIESGIIFTFLALVGVFLFAAVLFRQVLLLLIWLLITGVEILGFLFVTVLTTILCVRAIGVYPSPAEADRAYNYMNWLVVLGGTSFCMAVLSIYFWIVVFSLFRQYEEEDFEAKTRESIMVI